MCTSTEALAKRKAPFVHAPLDRSRALRPALHQASATTLPRPTHLIPTFVTIMIRPSLRDETARIGN
jgi:hypothetical protein